MEENDKVATALDKVNEQTGILPIKKYNSESALNNFYDYMYCYTHTDIGKALRIYKARWKDMYEEKTGELYINKQSSIKLAHWNHIITIDPVG